jgi:putative addiction module CopG family antidote
MPSTTLTVSLSEKTRGFLESELAEGPFTSASEYIEALLREASERKTREEVDRLLLASLADKSPSIEVTPQYWVEKKRKLHEQVGQSGHNAAS